ncbi:hypothetical protein [Streptomyces fuscigenes]|uniref:hypothetical protein n=1 Tax=Streptomyces fuscigenes TaxID=1528880 RepID=UPI001F1C7BD7|nr:hypothetical protein [Streptomyces fuscigenes]MCF3960293.1 hypothetical protein [Streptomyces fuscigenes]
MFTETVVHAGGTTEGTASEAHAFHLIRRALTRGYTVTPTENGGAVITWTVHLLGAGGHRRQPRSITLTPHTPAGPLTDQVRADLHTVHAATGALPAREDGRPIIRAGLCRIGPAATSRLYAHRLVLEQGGRVRLTLMAHLALLAAQHATPDVVAATFRPELTAHSA